jgi:hypothetical protein
MTQIIQDKKPVNTILFIILGAVFWFEALLLWGVGISLAIGYWASRSIR